MFRNIKEKSVSAITDCRNTWVTNSSSQTSSARNYCVACLCISFPVVHPLLAFRPNSFRFIASSDATFLCFITLSTPSSYFTAVLPRRRLPSGDKVVIL
jgi:hypothetical protein